jgi:crotonobetainyl-CoA:carnitine CoA-transferase CaiB-like acyl-CoA transferase
MFTALASALEGIRVADFSTHLPGPYATARLSEYGATVLKIEPPSGDPARHMFDGAIFHEVNVGKRSITLDLRDEDDHRAARALCRDADIIVEGFRPSIAERLRIAPDVLWADAADRPRLFVSIRTSTTDPVLAASRAHDVNVVATSGLMMAPVTWSHRDVVPLRPAIPIADIAAAERVTQAILAWTTQRAGGAPPGITHLTVGMLESLRAWTRIREVTIVDGEARYLDPANDVYQASDGRWLTLTALEDPAWRRMCALLPLPEDARAWMATLTAPGRLAEGDRVGELLAEALAAEPAAHWLDVLSAAGAAVAEVLSPPPSDPEGRQEGPALGETPRAITELADPWLALGH